MSILYTRLCMGFVFFLYPAPINDFNVQKWAISPGLGKHGGRFILK